MLLFEIFLAPVLIALVSLAGRKWGPGIAGWLLGIPLNSGPLLLFVALEQGPQFAARTAVGSLLGIIGWASFTLVYAHCCLRLPWWHSTILGWLAYFIFAALLVPVTLGVVAAFAIVCAALTLILWCFPRVAPPASLGVPGKYDLLLRMITASAMVVTLAGFARILGPMRSGILSAFPAYTTILAVFSHRENAAAAVTTIKGVAVGLYTAATLYLILSLALSRLNIAASFALALIGALGVQAASLLYLRRMA